MDLTAFLPWHERFRYRLLRQMTRFGLIGGASFVIDVGIYYALTRTTPFFGSYFILANAVSFVLAVTFNFFCNRRWTFYGHGRSVGPQYVKFFSIAVTGLTLNSAFLWFLVAFGHVPDVSAKFIAAAVVFFWNFNLQRLWTFKQNSGIMKHET